jgi:diguanylate cyclase (GGDEF)-like protein
MNTNYESADDTSMTARFRATLIMESLKPRPSPWRMAWMRIRDFVANVWSTTSFEDSKVAEYAEKMMLEQTRRGVIVMALLSLLTQVAAMLLYYRLGAEGHVFYTYSLLAVLSLHIVVSSRFLRETSSLHLLGTILLVFTGVAIMTIAHRTGTVNAALLASIVLLFMVMPIIPWGMRQACVIVGLTYLTFTVSSLSIAGRFDAETLWTLQFLMLASATIATLTIMRNTVIRRDDIKARYELESARKELQLISTRDPLTGAWNRRYLEQNFVKIARDARQEGRDLHLAVLDIDSFKQLNDNHGHHHGDETLCRLVSILMDNLTGTAHILRLGGDEFAVLDTSSDFEAAIDRCLQHLMTDPKLLQIAGEPVQVSVGYAVARPNETADLDAMYRRADEALYAEKTIRR